MEKQSTNISKGEIAKFNRHVEDWWDRSGSMKSLHDINPLRMAYIRQRITLKGKTVLDIGCGGGILTESIARDGANITGIDASENIIAVALNHERTSRSGAIYRTTTAEELAKSAGESYDAVFCLELLEHVPSPLSVIHACRTLLKPGGDLIFATINRNAMAWFLAIVMAEYLLGLLTPGTHAYRNFIKPSELINMGKSQGLAFSNIRGFSYNPLSQKYYMCQNTMVNYMLHLKKDEHPIDRISKKLNPGTSGHNTSTAFH